MWYPPGSKTWPIELPQLDPGTYTFAVPGVTCDADQHALEATFRISAAPTAPNTTDGV